MPNQTILGVSRNLHNIEKREKEKRRVKRAQQGRERENSLSAITQTQRKFYLYYELILTFSIIIPYSAFISSLSPSLRRDLLSCNGDEELLFPVYYQNLNGFKKPLPRARQGRGVIIIFWKCYWRRSDRGRCHLLLLRLR